jgi:hypothetical protein
LLFPRIFHCPVVDAFQLEKPDSGTDRDLVQQRPLFVELMCGLAWQHKIYICVGTIPAPDEGDSKVDNDGCLFAPSGSSTSRANCT